MAVTISHSDGGCSRPSHHARHLVDLLCATLFYLGKWNLPAGLSIALLFLHFTLWARMTGTWASPIQEIRSYGLASLGIWISMLFHFGFPLWGFLAWARYLKCDRVAANAADSLAGGHTSVI